MALYRNFVLYNTEKPHQSLGCEMLDYVDRSVSGGRAVKQQNNKGYPINSMPHCLDGRGIVMPEAFECLGCILILG